MDDADLRLLGTVQRWQVCRPSGWDPRISIRRLADEAGLPRTTAWERMSWWRESGFFLGCGVIPNPLVLSGRMASMRLRVERPGGKAPIMEAAGLMDGFLGGIDVLGDQIILVFAGDGVPGLERKARLLSQMQGVASCQGPMLYPGWEEEPPAPDERDWRLIDRLVRGRDADLAELAPQLGIGERALKRRYARLIENRQVLFRPELDYSALPGATGIFLVHFDPRRPEKELGMELLEVTPEAIPFCDPFETPEGESIPMFMTVSRRRSPADFHAAVEALSAVDGVTDVEVLFPVRTWVETDWFRERIAQLAPG